MAETEFRLRGAEELEKDLRKLQERYPSEASDAVYKCANKFTKDVNKKFPSRYKRLPKKWKKDRVAGIGGLTSEIDVTNTAPEFHLVENGHELYFSPGMYAAYKLGKLQFKNTNRKTSRKGGKHGLIKMGFVPGKKYCADTRSEWQGGKYEEELGAQLDKMLEKHNL